MQVIRSLTLGHNLQNLWSCLQNNRCIFSLTEFLFSKSDEKDNLFKAFMKISALISKSPSYAIILFVWVYFISFYMFFVSREFCSFGQGPMTQERVKLSLTAEHYNPFKYVENITNNVLSHLNLVSVQFFYCSVIVCY